MPLASLVAAVPTLASPAYQDSTSAVEQDSACFAQETVSSAPVTILAHHAVRDSLSLLQELAEDVLYPAQAALQAILQSVLHALKDCNL